MNEKEILKALDPVANRLGELALHTDRDMYAQWLAQTYFFVKHSIPLLELAIQKSSNPSFIARGKEHLKEEAGHDKVALSDLRNLGVKAEELKEWQWTKDFYNRQYELVSQKGELLLGYILALEGLAILSAPAAGPVIEVYGNKATKFAKIHVEEDQEHLPHAIKQTLELDCKEEILKNFQTTLDEYGDFVSQLQSHQIKIAA